MYTVGCQVICVSIQLTDDKIMATINKEGIGKCKQQSQTN